MKNLFTLFLCLAASTVLNGQTSDKKTLNLKGAEAVIAAAKAEAQQLNAPGGVIAVVDDGGNLMALERLDGTFSAGANISLSPESKRVQLLTTELKGPNGLAFSPDEKYFYVDNWDTAKKIIMRYDVQPDSTLANGKIFFDMTSANGEDALDGMKIDQKGNLYVSGPGGLWIISPEGKHLGTIIGPEHPHNFAWGDDDGKTLYLCARTGLYRIRLNIPGVRP